jgi:hypothetical protein
MLVAHQPSGRHPQSTLRCRSQDELFAAKVPGAPLRPSLYADTHHEEAIRPFHPSAMTQLSRHARVGRGILSREGTLPQASANARA